MRHYALVLALTSLSSGRAMARDENRPRAQNQIHHIKSIVVHAPKSKPDGQPWDPRGPDELPDLYVQIARGGSRVATTDVRRNSLDATFRLDFAADPKDGPLVLTIWDKDPVKDELIGRVAIDFERQPEGGTRVFSFADGTGSMTLIDNPTGRK